MSILWTISNLDRGGGGFLAYSPESEAFCNRENNNISLKKGFTLAEVLITLGVIGVVAALTMPVLITDYQKKDYC